MSREYGRRKKISLGKIAMLCMLAPALYVAFQLYHINRDAYEYETAISYTMADSIETDGVVLLDGTPVEGGGDLGYLVQDGERVSAGTRVAEIYTSGDQAGIRSQLDGLNTQISLLQKSQNISSTQVDVLISQRGTAVYDLLESIDRHDTSQLSGIREDYLLAQNKLQITTGEASGFSAQIGDLTAQRDALAEQLASLEGVAAPAGGYFVSCTSMQVLNMASADITAMTADDFQNWLQNGTQAATDGMAGMIVPSYTWQYCGICTAEQAEKFNDVKTVSISFPGKAETKLPAEVVSVEASEDGSQYKFILQCEYISADILKLGRNTAQIDFHTYSGLRISTSAVHLVLAETVPEAASSLPDADASSSAPSAASSAEENSAAASEPASSSEEAAASAQGNSDYVSGVYVKYGNLARFRRIQVLYQDPDGEYILVAPNGGVGTDNEVRLYDEVIVSGINLYDGKLL